MTFNCWKCGASIDLPTGARVGNRDTCPKCGSDLHSCRNCDFYDPAKNNRCSEPQAEWVRDKEAANYCDCYRPNPTLFAGRQGSRSDNDVRKKFDSLFKV